MFVCDGCCSGEAECLYVMVVAVERLSVCM